MQDIQHDIRRAIQEDDVSRHKNVSAIGRRRRQNPLQLGRTGLDPLLEARRQRPVARQLFL